MGQDPNRFLSLRFTQQANKVMYRKHSHCDAVLTNPNPPLTRKRSKKPQLPAVNCNGWLAKILPVGFRASIQLTNYDLARHATPRHATPRHAKTGNARDSLDNGRRQGYRAFRFKV